jgi:murein DD-endopeptidase MepM/ murein hydrolase activator NlpD
MKKLFGLIIFLSPSLGLTAQEYLAVSKSAEATDDEKVAGLTSSEYESVWDINDSLNFIPAFDDYCDWNTERVHPYKNNLTTMRDTVLIPLAYDSCSFAAPFIGRKTSDFGYRRYRYHYGVDIKLYTGDPVVSAFEGVVRIAQYDGDYGRVVVVRHNNGLETLYAHLSKLNVKEGDWVEAGEVVGLGGNSGRSTGSHLHFEARYLGEPIDPNALIDWSTGTLLHDTLALNQEHFEYLIEVRRRKYHTIRRGDTLSGIARRYGTSVSNLCKLNGMRSTTTLRIGRSIRYN